MRLRVAITIILISITFAACKRRATFSTSTAPSPCAPTIVQHPENTTVSPGQGAVLTVVAQGEGPFRYEWYELVPGKSKALPGNVSKVTVTPKATSSYFVWVYNKCGGKISNLATVKVQ